mmetsp:Transcript_6177/g.9616  ORF Transcript_6177/g.9616 Transcript_6177/m.9616 type:complete len:262 (+) Transcript_6177:26-811(+)
MLSQRIVALVSGGASGLGLATAKRLAKQGGRVWIFDQNEKLGKQVEQQEENIAFVCGDITSEVEVASCLDEIQKGNDGQPLNVLVNCAGIAYAIKTLSRGKPHPLDKFEQTLRVNTVGSFNLIRLASDRMSKAELCPERNLHEKERGVIINTASVAAYDGQIGQAAYSASKGAIVGMTLPIARDLSSYGIRVNTIAPGVFATPMVDGLPPVVKEHLAKQVPFPSKLGDPDEYAHLVQSIIENPMLNGESIRIDGALRMPPK